jgi:hypothetical protein
MPGREIKSEVIRLVNTVDADRMEDLLSTIRAFTDQQGIETDIDHNSPELLKKESGVNPLHSTSFQSQKT